MALSWDDIIGGAGDIAAVGSAAYPFIDKLTGGTGGMGGSTYDTTKTNDPWAVATPYMTDAMRQAEELYRSGTGSEYYPGATTTPMGYDTSTGLNMMRDTAMGGNPLQGASEEGLLQMMGGGTNPYLQDMYDMGAKNIGESVNSAFSGAGRYGSGAHTGMLTEGLGNFGTGLFGGAYNADQNRRLEAMRMAPGVSQNRYADAERMMGIGGTVEGYQDRERQADMDRFNFYQQNPYERLGNYANLVGTMGGMGGTQTGDITQGTDMGWGQILGGIGNIASEFGGGDDNTYEPYPGYNQGN